ncbi:MAG TPA: hypothetical protein VFZ00_19990 [Solirubrobacter sp.]|jgi:hypothetical protein|nr:hypothetical protein [Solirubrobacter sp.]
MLVATLATAALAATSFTIDVRDTGEIRRVGDLRPKQYLGEGDFKNAGVVPNRRNAIRAFGRPDRKDANGCGNIWRRLGLRLITADFSGGPPCTPRTRIQQIEITSKRWTTERGLRVGDSLDRVRELYPKVRRFTDLYGEAGPYRYRWALVLEPSRVGGPPNLIDRLSAEIRKRKVVSLTVSPYGAGD